jgi:hypothetical protein
LRVPPDRLARAGGPGSGRGRKRGLCAQIQAEVTAEVERLAASVATRLDDGPEGGGGPDGGLGAVESAIRAGMLAVGGSLLSGLLALDGGHRRPRVECGQGHLAEFVAYRDKTIGTVLGPATLRRAWYHCAVCGHGLAPRDSELQVAHASMTSGLRRMIARAGAAVPFAPAADLLGELAGVEVNAKRVARVAEADGLTAAAVIEARATAIRTLVPLPPSLLPDILYTAIDGAGVPMTSTETEDRPGKTDRPDLPDDDRRDSAGRWHIAFAAIPAAIPAPGTGEVVGVDRGVAVAAAHRLGL